MLIPALPIPNVFTFALPILLLTCPFPFTSATAPSATPFGLEYAFSVNLTLGTLFNPIPIPGGVTVTETITSGTVSGPAVNATIEGGTAYAAIYTFENQTVQVPQIDAYGTTSDGLSFAIHESGIGAQSAQITRINFNVNGTQYSHLVNGYVLAAVRRMSETTVEVDAYLVSNTP